MAATDIQYGGLDPVLYTPDYSFLKYVLDKKTANYEKGLQSASSSYNNLKKELTDPKNVQKRDQYLKDVQGQLQTIASSDFSLQQNVNYANSIFEPIATDKALVFDAYHTARLKNELAKEDGWEKSEDPEVRKMYNSDIKKWVMKDVEALKNGNGDLKNYKVEGRSAFAYVDPQDILKKEAKDRGFEYKVDEFNNPYIITTKGGVGGSKNYEQFASDILGSNEVYKKQSAIIGESKAEQIIDNYKTDSKLAPIWANKTNEEILNHYALNSYDNHKKEQEDWIALKNKNVTKDFADINAEINGPNSAKYIQGATDVSNGNANTDEAKMWLSIKKKADETNSLKDRVKDLQSDFNATYSNNDNKVNYLNNFKSSKAAGNYFADLQTKNDITRFSNIQSASVSRTIKEDKAVIDVLVAKTNAMAALNKIQTTQHDDNLNDAKFQEQLRMDDAKLAAMGKKKVKNADGTTSIVDGSAEITPIDRSAVQVQATKVLTYLKDQVSNATAGAINNATSTYGSFYIFKAAGQNDKEVGLLNNAFSRYMSSNDKKEFSLTKEEQTALDNANNYALAYSKNNPNSDLSTYIKQRGSGKIQIGELPDLAEHAANGIETKDQNILQAKRSMDDYKKNIDKIKLTSASLDAGSKVVASALKNDSEYKDMFQVVVDKKTGAVTTTDKLIDSDYIYKRLKVANNIGGVTKVGDFFQRNTYYVKLSDEDLKDLSTAYINGTVIFDNKSKGNSDSGEYYYTNIIYKGQKYRIDAIGNWGEEHVVPYDTKDYQNKLQRINERTPIPQFVTAAGGVIASPFYQLKGGTEDLVLHDLAKVTLTNSYILEDAATPIPVKPEDQLLIRNALLEKGNVTDVSLFTSSPLSSGGQSVSVTFKTESGKNPPMWSGRTFQFPISPTETSPNIFHYFNDVNKISSFEKYKSSGDTYKMNAFQADGVRAEVVPLSPGSNEGVVRMFYKPYNSVTKKYADTEIQYTDANGNNEIQYNLGKTTFPELEESIYKSFIYPFVQGKITYSKQVQANASALGNTPITTDVLKKQLHITN